MRDLLTLEQAPANLARQKKGVVTKSVCFRILFAACPVQLGQALRDLRRHLPPKGKIRCHRCGVGAVGLPHLLNPPERLLNPVPPIAPLPPAGRCERLAQALDGAAQRIPQQADVGRVFEVGFNNERITAPDQPLRRDLSRQAMAQLDDPGIVPGTTWFNRRMGSAGPRPVLLRQRRCASRESGREPWPSRPGARR